ncbi:MAG: nicotinate (nicotinamide) nucleotide adenylyltransferase [Chlorobiales bacterium]|nr:nicotinate (nicotinamide) nucleotide adenylyltransferase [Chlorobiales bacterium]
MKIALFGGTFDPPHNGHLAVCTLTRELFSPDRMILSVSKNPLKETASAPEYHQLEMTRLFCEELNKTGNIFEVSDWELRRDGPSYTVDTLAYLQSQFPQATLQLCIGEDNYRIFTRWKNYEKILEMAELVVFARPHKENGLNEILGLHPNRLHWVDLDLPLSSTELRHEIASGTVRWTKMPGAISRYIQANRLYGYSSKQA